MKNIKRKKILILFSVLILLSCRFNNVPDNKSNEPITEITPSPEVSDKDIIPANVNLPQKSFCFNDNDIYKFNQKLELEGKINFNQSTNNIPIKYWSPDKHKFIALIPKEGVKLININDNEVKTVPVNNIKNFKEVKWSPLSDKVSFLDEDESETQILKVLNLKGELTKISEIPEILIDENISETYSWSGDGKKIAYGFKDIYTINPDGSDNVKITDVSNDFQNDKHIYYFPQWSSDGKYISFFDKYLEAIPEIYIMTSDGKEKKEIGYSKILKWFPDNNNFLYISEASNNDTYKNFSWLKVNAENPSKKPLKFIDPTDSLEFLPNQERILFNINRNIYTINYDDEDKALIVNPDNFSGFGYNISDDGKKIIYSTYDNKSSFTYYPGATKTGLYIVNPDGTGKITIFEKKLPSENSIYNDLSKDGNLVFYNFNGKYIFNVLDNSTIRIDTFLPNECGYLSWY